MSRHVPRRARWEGRGPSEYRSSEGLVVRYEKRAWWADVAYLLLVEGPTPDAPPAAEPHSDRLGPFRRPRNAMVEAERHATLLRNRHGERVRFAAPGDSAPAS